MSTPSRRLSLTVDALVCAETEIKPRIYAGENRVVMSLHGDGMCDVHVYTDRIELVRLRDALTAALADLDTARAALAAGADVTGSQDAA